MNVNELVMETLSMYEDACGYEAAATWSDDEGLREMSEALWNQYEGARSLLSALFHISDQQVDDDMEALMYAKVFS